ncbi:hypothetical protein N0V85_008321 [Neurospora sp. IMI 360204]|nr:hypothetical protein N0V85_008321 [Neurospora sp. IMI 360204]
MAPVTDTFPIPGLEGLILRQFRAVVLQTKDNFRGPLLVETGPTIYWALHSLMVKSAESVQNYIQTSGFAIVPSASQNSTAAKQADDSSNSTHGSDDNQEHDDDSVYFVYFALLQIPREEEG